MTRPETRLRPGLLALATLVLACVTACADVWHPTGWLDDFAAAQAAARKTARPILAMFGGSDWCPYCVLLEREVFSQPAFKAYAGTNLVLFLADFPRETKLPERVERQNQELVERYHVPGAPFVLLLDPDGQVLGTAGYRPGGAEAFVSRLQSQLKEAGWKPLAATPTTTNQPAPHAGAADKK